MTGPAKPTVCLSMIVKDEAPVIARCLASVRPLIDHWVVVDTGSTDGTQDIVRTALADLPGGLVERPWRDFAHNRSEALELARGHGTYSLIIDADDILDVPDGFRLPELTADSYTLDIAFGASRYRRPQLVRAALPWRYEGVIHEFLACEDSQSADHLPGPVIRIGEDGARRRDPGTFRRDAAVLERALAEAPTPFLASRYTFYLAQSYRDSGNHRASLAAYLRRAEMGFWTEEVYFSLYQAGKLMEVLGHDPETIIATYARASAASPSRAEAAHAASRFCRGLSRFAEGAAVAETALGLPVAEGGLFVETWIYEYGLLDEYAVNAYWCGRYRDCLDASLRALEGGKVPASDQPRFLANMRFALDKLPAPLGQTAAEAPALPPRVSAPAVPLPTRLHLGSGKDFRSDWLNIDIDATWNPDAVIDLSKVRLDPQGVAVETARFGLVRLRPGMFDEIVANDVLEHVPDLVPLMTTCLALLRVGGVFRIEVPYDLALGAWQDPTHVRTFNERSWLYYSDWFWYLGWREARFAVEVMEHLHSPLGEAMRQSGVSSEETVRTPRAIDAMRVVLRKTELTPGDRAALAHWRDRKSEAATASRTGVAASETPAVGADAGEAAPIAFAGPWAASRDRYCVYVVSPADYAHHLAFHDAAQALSEAFVALGGSAPVVTDPTAWRGRTPIVFGCHLLTRFPVADLPPEAVLINLEPMDATAEWVDEAYLALLRRRAVLDYSVRNTQALKAAGITHARHLAIRAMPRPAGDGEPDCDIDVLFYGSINPRRRVVLDALRARGLSVTELFGVYGEQRDAAAARAKVVLNIHFYETAIFEAVRVCTLLAHGACVVSEGEPDDPDVADLADGLVLCPYAMLVDRCCALVADAAERQALSTRARAVIAARPQSAILQAFFPDAAPVPVHVA